MTRVAIDKRLRFDIMLSLVFAAAGFSFILSVDLFDRLIVWTRIYEGHELDELLLGLLLFFACFALVRWRSASLELDRRIEAERALQEAMAQKDRLLHEVHHRVRNNLQVMLSLLRINASFVESDSEQRLLQEYQGRIRAISSAHDVLYRSDSLSGVNMKDYVSDMVRALVSLHANDRALVKVQTEIDDAMLAMEEAVPLGMIINELVSNSLKHAFPDGSTGVVKVAFSRSADGKCSLAVTDDGVGLPFGITLDSPVDMGINMIYILSKQINGTVSFSAPGDPGGTHCSVAFSH